MSVHRGSPVNAHARCQLARVCHMCSQRQENAISIFMGVPTMYTYLLNAYDKMDAAGQDAARAAARRLRLTVCGSSACPLPVMERWRELSGVVLPATLTPRLPCRSSAWRHCEWCLALTCHVPHIRAAASHGTHTCSQHDLMHDQVSIHDTKATH